MLAAAGLQIHAATIMAFGLDPDSIAQAEDDDWNDFGIPQEDGRAIRLLMRRELCYTETEP